MRTIGLDMITRGTTQVSPPPSSPPIAQRSLEPPPHPLLPQSLLVPSPDTPRLLRRRMSCVRTEICTSQTTADNRQAFWSPSGGLGTHKIETRRKQWPGRCAATNRTPAINFRGLALGSSTFGGSAGGSATARVRLLHEPRRHPTRHLPLKHSVTGKFGCGRGTLPAAGGRITQSSARGLPPRPVPHLQSTLNPKA